MFDLSRGLSDACSLLQSLIIVYVCVCLCACMCLWIRVCERERERVCVIPPIFSPIGEYLFFHFLFFGLYVDL